MHSAVQNTGEEGVPKGASGVRSNPASSLWQEGEGTPTVSPQGAYKTGPLISLTER